MILESEKENKLFQLRNHPLGPNKVCDGIKEDRSTRKQGIKWKLKFLKNQLLLKEDQSRKETVAVTLKVSH